MPNTRTLVLKNADMLVTMDAARREIAGGCVHVEDNRIVAFSETRTFLMTL